MQPHILRQKLKEVRDLEKSLNPPLKRSRNGEDISENVGRERKSRRKGDLDKVLLKNKNKRQKKRVRKQLLKDHKSQTKNQTKKFERSKRLNSTEETKKRKETPPTSLAKAPPTRNTDEVYIVGGGTSLKGFDFSNLIGTDIIAVNKSIEDVPNATCFLTMDYTLLTSNQKKFNFEDILPKSQNNVFVLNQCEDGRIVKRGNCFVDTKFNYTYWDLHKFSHIISSKQVIDEKRGFGATLSSFANGGNSGFCATQLAILMGYKKIHLLGIDLNIQKNKTHYHEGYGGLARSFIKSVPEYARHFQYALDRYKDKDKLLNYSPEGALKNHLWSGNLNDIFPQESMIENLKDLLIVGYYTKNTLYETEAQKTIDSCKELGLNHDIIGIDCLGGWQSNTRHKAIFMKQMLEKHRDKRLLYVDCDAIIRKVPVLFANPNYSCDIAVRWQDFRWRKNECLSGTIYMENNPRTHRLCELWVEHNVSDKDQKKGMEQWNLDKAITVMKDEGLIVNNLPPEYTFIFDSMKKMYPKAQPVIEHFQASRKARKIKP